MHSIKEQSYVLWNNKQQLIIEQTVMVQSCTMYAWATFIVQQENTPHTPQLTTEHQGTFVTAQLIIKTVIINTHNMDNQCKSEFKNHHQDIQFK